MGLSCSSVIWAPYLLLTRAFYGRLMWTTQEDWQPKLQSLTRGTFSLKTVSVNGGGWCRVACEAAGSRSRLDSPLMRRGASGGMLRSNDAIGKHALFTTTVSGCRRLRRRALRVLHSLESSVSIIYTLIAKSSRCCTGSLARSRLTLSVNASTRPNREALNR